MSILGRLKDIVWNREMEKTHSAVRDFLAQKRCMAQEAYDAVMREANAEAAQMLSRLTPVQDAISGIESDDDPEVGRWTYNSMAQVMPTQSHMAQAQQAYLKQQAMLNQAMPSYRYTLSQQNTGTSIYSNPYQNTLSPRGYTFGSTTRDALFTTLRAVEEQAAEREHIHGYDWYAYNLMDVRKMKQDTINLVDLVSFCVANMEDVLPIKALLEGHGIAVK